MKRTAVLAAGLAIAVTGAAALAAPAAADPAPPAATGTAATAKRLAPALPGPAGAADPTARGLSSAALARYARWSAERPRAGTPTGTVGGAGALAVSARDARTGAPVARFCATVAGDEGSRACTSDGVVALRGLAVGVPLPIVVRPDGGGSRLGDFVAATPRAGEPAAVTARFGAGGTIRAKMTDGRTGAILDDRSYLWVRTVGPDRSWAFVEAEERDAEGWVHTDALPPGTYRILAGADPRYDLGDQWVGPDGGTGREHLAAQITVREGEETTAPTVRFDPGGTVRGTVHLADGTPLVGGAISNESLRYNDYLVWYYYTDAAGHYESPALGPYDWSFRIGASWTRTPGADQWGGGAREERDAATVRIEAGAEVERDFTLAPGVVLGGAVTGPAGTERHDLIADAADGLVAGVFFTNAEATYAHPVLGGRSVKVQASTVEGVEIRSRGWHDNADSYAAAAPIAVPATGTATADLRFPAAPR
ncbi:hypothetical protein GCM10010123_45170 [Pilimelia anulata]|uniref:Rhamnogalacturonan endolyase n=1 Tax=Pilimelia anulata TaxID=53371 RepID=A0A8J3BCR9_9ACTN|nr:hypothetical protein [Pilimelia anulata]GGK10181.1 hypothetical protein GCM10010123_45170 [Pilimelia anulata]